MLGNVIHSMPMTFKENNNAKSISTLVYKAKAVLTYVSQYGNNVESSACDICKLLMEGLKAVIASNMTESQAIDSVAGLCTSIGIYPEEVCYYAMLNFLPELMYVVSAVEDTISVDNMCGFIVAGSCVNENEFLPVFDWNVTFPSPEPPYVPPPQPDPTSPKIRILHMSDTHYDEQYLEGSISSCDEPMCCRANSKTPNEIVSYGGKYGGLNGSCDIPKLTLESMLEYASTNLEFDFVYWTGDIPPHDVWNQTKAGNIQMLESTCALVRQYFTEDNTVIASCGNHESEPVNSFPVPDVYQDYDIAYLYTQLDSVWTTFLPDIDHSTVLKGGYYAYDVKPGLRVISLNMNYCHNGNWWLLIQSQDPTEEVQWLVDQLDDAEKNNIKVHLIGHIPPGKCVWVWSRNYRDVLDRYKATVTGHFYGHTHNDEFEMIYDDEDTTLPISVAHIAPSVTTYSKMNPSFRIYIVDGDYTGTTYQVLDYEEYWLDVNKANADGFPKWELLYTAKDTYGLADFTAASFDDFINRMETDDPLFQTFYQNYNRVFDNAPCDSTCKNDLLCNLRRGWGGYTYDNCDY